MSSHGVAAFLDHIGAGHISSRGYWHPGRAEGCPKCEPPKPPCIEITLDG